MEKAFTLICRKRGDACVLVPPRQGMGAPVPPDSAARPPSSPVCQVPTPHVNQPRVAPSVWPAFAHLVYGLGRILMPSIPVQSKGQLEGTWSTVEPTLKARRGPAGLSDFCGLVQLPFFHSRFLLHLLV